ncbi:MAG: redoxin domain-containing protein [Fulvivirga sp.]
MKALLIIFLTCTTLWVSAQSVDNFTLDDANFGKKVSLSDYKNKKAIVVIFTSNVCPYAVYYEGRITQLISEFDNDNVQFLLINAHSDEKESQEQMTNKIKTWGLKVPYLADKNQDALKKLGAKKSPEAFVLKPVGEAFEVFYRGAIDNNPQVASDVKTRYLKDNINNLLAGKAATSGGRPIGCMIR